MTEATWPFEEDNSDQHFDILEKLDKGIDLTEEEQHLLESMDLAGGISDSEELSLEEALKKWENGEDLTYDEEQLVVESFTGKNNMGG